VAHRGDPARHRRGAHRHPRPPRRRGPLDPGVLNGGPAEGASGSRPRSPRVCRGPVGVGVRRGAANRWFWLFALGWSASPGSSTGAASSCFLSHKTPCHPSPQKQIGTPAQLREPTRTPLLYSRPMTRSPRKTPEGAKREEGGENAVNCCGEAGPRAPRCPLKLTEQAGPNGPESHAVASP